MHECLQQNKRDKIRAPHIFISFRYIVIAVIYPSSTPVIPGYYLTVTITSEVYRVATTLTID